MCWVNPVVDSRGKTGSMHTVPVLISVGYYSRLEVVLEADAGRIQTWLLLMGIPWSPGNETGCRLKKTRFLDKLPDFIESDFVQGFDFECFLALRERLIDAIDVVMVVQESDAFLEMKVFGEIDLDFSAVDE